MKAKIIKVDPWYIVRGPKYIELRKVDFVQNGKNISKNKIDRVILYCDTLDGALAYLKRRFKTLKYSLSPFEGLEKIQLT